MKSFLRNIIVFATGFALMIVCPVLLISECDNLDKTSSENNNIISLQTKSSFDSLDILFVGNSYCYSSINTIYFDSLNIDTYNLGIATSGVQFYNLLINDYYDHVRIFPKKVLLLVSPMTFSSKSDNFDAYPIHRYLEDEMTNLEIVFRFNRLGQLFSMYKKSLEKGLLYLSSPRKSFCKESRMKNKGFVPSDKVVSLESISNDEHLYLPFKNESFDGSKVTDLLDIADYIKEKGSEVIFFELPTNKLSEYFSSDYLSEYQKGLDTIKQKYSLIHVRTDLFMQEHYRNIDHMNSSGATIATAEIIEYLTGE